MQPNAQKPAAAHEPTSEVPLREQTWADHDEPWRYQPYHLGLREKLALLRWRDRMIAQEHGLTTSAY
ncbi:MAG: hypothetical protein HY329_08285 [Chloroflexi bacterium]|nr:hypothetical protein [Chloroflexota bacterium]